MGRTSPPSAPRWWSGSCAAAASPTSGCWRRWGRCRARPSCRARLRHRAYADSALPIGERPDDLPALDRRRDLPGAGAERRRAGARGRHRLGLLGLRALAAGGRGGQHRAPRVARPAPRAKRSPRSAVTNVEVIVGDGSRGLPERAPFEAIAVHATAPAPPPTAARPARRGRPPRGPDRRRRRRPADRPPPPRRRGRDRGDRPLPLRPPDRRGGLRR